MIKLERILMPTDFSECSSQACAYASEIARRFDAELLLLHVVPPAPTAYTYAAPISTDTLFPVEPAEKELNEFDVPEGDKISRLSRDVVQGVPFVEIIRQAREKGVGLIVMGTHGRTGLTHVLLGSVAEKVVRKAPCPVLTVRPEGHQFVMP